MVMIDDDVYLDEVWHELGQVGDHAGHAALGDGAQSQDPRLLDLPLRMEQSFLQQGVIRINNGLALENETFKQITIK